MKPRIPITDKRFVYRNAANTDVRATIQRAREELKKSAPIPLRKAR